jgi:hypothetical protein
LGSCRTHPTYGEIAVYSVGVISAVVLIRGSVCRTKAQEQVLSTTGSGDQKSPPADSTDGAEAESATSAFELVRSV